MAAGGAGEGWEGWGVQEGNQHLLSVCHLQHLRQAPHICSFNPSLLCFQAGIFITSTLWIRRAKRG